MSSRTVHEPSGWSWTPSTASSKICRAFTDRHVWPAVGEAEALGHLPQRLWKKLGRPGC
jgi:hypothetical protein